MRCSKVSICDFVRSRIARCASLSLARFFASWSGVRLATPRPEPIFRFLEMEVVGEVDSARGVSYKLGEARVFDSEEVDMLIDLLQVSIDRCLVA